MRMSYFVYTWPITISCWASKHLCSPKSSGLHDLMVHWCVAVSYGIEQQRVMFWGRTIGDRGHSTNCLEFTRPELAASHTTWFIYRRNTTFSAHRSTRIRIFHDASQAERFASYVILSLYLHIRPHLLTHRSIKPFGKRQQPLIVLALGHLVTYFRTRTREFHFQPPSSINSTATSAPSWKRTCTKYVVDTLSSSDYTN